MKPTPEQVDATDKFLTGKALRVNAYAGTGKTSTLIHMAGQTRKRGVYVCFNKSIADEAKKKFPGNISCSTMHGLAYRAMMRRFDTQKMTGSLSGGFLAAKLDLPSRTLGPETDPLVLTPRGVGTLIVETLRRWQRSGRPEITDHDCPLVGRLETLDEKTAKALQNDVAERAKMVWSLMLSKDSTLPLGHDGYLKLWALGRPRLAGDFILLDEAQDTNGVVMEIMRHQEAQLVTVGDKHQQIYEWRGAQNAMVELPAEVESRLTTSFRFGERIADNASRILWLLDEELPLRGNPAKRDALCPVPAPDAVLCRNNSTLLAELFDAIEKGVRPHIVGGVREVLDYVGASEKLMEGRAVERPLEFFGFANWHQVVKAANDEDDKDLKRWVKLIEDHTPSRLRAVLETLPHSEVGAGLILSTGHKAKGREWGAVRLTGDFLRGVKAAKQDGKAEGAAEPKEDEDDGQYLRRAAPELRLFYVAATRAQAKLEIPDALEEKMETLEKGYEDVAAAE